MALQVNNFTGFETGGAEEVVGTSGSPDFTEATIVGSGIRSVKLGSGSSDQVDIAWVASGITDAGGKYIFGYRFYFDATGAAVIHNIQVRDDTSTSTICGVRVNASEQLELLDAANGVLDTSSALNAGEWHFVAVFADLNNASGDWEWFINGVSEGSGTGADFTDGNTFGSSSSFLRFSKSTIAINSYFDDVYILSGATAASDAFTDAEVFLYQNTVEDATDQGDALAGGTWALVGEIPLNEGASNEADYENTGNLTGSTICDSADSNARPGPSGDADVDGDSNIKAAKWIGRFKRGTGGGRTHNFYGGNDGAGASHATWIASNDAKTLGMALTTGYATFTMLSESTEVPSSSEDFQYGFSKDSTAGQDIFCGDIWAMLLHVPSTGPAPTIHLTMAPYTPAGR